MVEYDPGPPPDVADHLAALPDLSAHKDLFWYDWGPVYYRGRLDGSARVLGVASDPGPTERVVGRTLVGDAGQRVQGFLRRLGLTRSYVLTNAHPYALFPSRGSAGLKLLRNHLDLKTWRNALYDRLMGPGVQAIVAFGGQAQRAVKLWPGKGNTPVFDVPHPSSHNAAALVAAWAQAITDLRLIVTPDPDGSNTGANYGAEFTESDFARIPPRDMPWGLPAWVGDDAWGRQATPRHNNAVWRPTTDPVHTLVWVAPPS